MSTVSCLVQWPLVDVAICTCLEVSAGQMQEDTTYIGQSHSVNNDVTYTVAMFCQGFREQEV